MQSTPGISTADGQLAKVKNTLSLARQLKLKLKLEHGKTIQKNLKIAFKRLLESHLLYVPIGIELRL